MNPLKRFAIWVSTESAVLAYGLNALVTAWAAFGFRASPAQTAAVTTIGAAVVTIITAFSARPVSVPVITGAVSTVAVASAAFGLHLSSAQIGAGVPRPGADPVPGAAAGRDPAGDAQAAAEPRARACPDHQRRRGSHRHPDGTEGAAREAGDVT